MRRAAGYKALLVAALLAWTAQGAAQKRGRIIGLRVRGDALVAVIEVQADRPLSFTTLRLTAPPRLVLDFADWEALRDRLTAAGMIFAIAPHVRFVGAAGEQATMFCRDPAGNALEFKAFRDIKQLFAT